MRERRDDSADMIAVVTMVSGIGLALLMVPLVATISRFNDVSAERNLRAALFLLALGWPFALGFATRWWPQEFRVRRWLWLLCFLGVLVPAYFLLALGIFFVAAALVWPWAFWMTRDGAGRHRA